MYKIFKYTSALTSNFNLTLINMVRWKGLWNIMTGVYDDHRLPHLWKSFKKKKNYYKDLCKMWSFNCFRVESIHASTSGLTHPEEHSNKAVRSKAFESSKAGWWVCLIYALIPIHALPGLPGDPTVHNFSNTPVLFFKQKKAGRTNWLHEMGWFGPNLPTIRFKGACLNILKGNCCEHSSYFLTSR